MAELNILQAADILDNDLDADAIKFLMDTRRVVILEGDEEETEQRLIDLNLIQLVPFSNPRVLVSIMGYALTDNGQKVLNIIDERDWNHLVNPENHPDVTIYADDGEVAAPDPTPEKGKGYVAADAGETVEDARIEGAPSHDETTKSDETSEVVNEPYTGDDQGAPLTTSQAKAQADVNLKAK